MMASNQEFRLYKYNQPCGYRKHFPTGRSNGWAVASPRDMSVSLAAALLSLLVRVVLSFSNSMVHGGTSASLKSRAHDTGISRAEWGACVGLSVGAA